MIDLEQIRDALESAKTFLGQEILWKESNYVRGHGEKKYSELCVALSIIDRMIETPAPQDAPMLTGDIKVGVTTFRQGVKLSTVQACIDSHINSMPKTAPQGWKLVPIEPTEEMSLTFRREWQDMDIRGKLRSEMFKAAYKAMLSAAPTPAPTEKVDVDALKKTFEPSSIMDNSVKVETLNYVTGWNECIDYLESEGRLR